MMYQALNCTNGEVVQTNDIQALYTYLTITPDADIIKLEKDNKELITSANVTVQNFIKNGFRKGIKI